MDKYFVHVEVVQMATFEQSPASRHAGYDTSYSSKVSKDAKCMFWGQFYHSCSIPESTSIFIFTFIKQKPIYLSILVLFTSDLTFWLKDSDLSFEGSLTPNEAELHSSLIYTNLLNTTTGGGQCI